MSILSLTKQKSILFGGAILMYFALNMQRVSIPGTIFNELQSTFDASATALANLATTFMIAYALAQFPAGILADRYGGMKTLLGGGALMTLGCFLFAFAPWYPLLVVSRFLIGFGGGFIYLSLLKEIGRNFPDRFAPMAGMVLLLGYIGGFLATMPLAKLTEHIGWRPAISLCATVGLLAVAVILLFWRAQTPVPKAASQLPGLQLYKNAFTNVNNLKIFCSYSVNFGLYTVVLTVFGKKFLEDIGHLSSTSAAVTCGIMVLIPAVSNPLAGLLLGKFGGRRKSFFMIPCYLPTLTCSLLLIGTLSWVPAEVKKYFFIPAFLLFSLTAGFSSISCCLAREFNPLNGTGVAIGILNFAAYSMVAVWGFISGLILDQFADKAVFLENGHVIYPNSAYIAIFVLFLLVGVVTYCIARTIPETRGKNIYQGKIIEVRLFRRFVLRFNR